ncbi:GNAT family N-acetyltransferase [Alkalihalobacillus pseudalcaliphilus]|uniref:GNAT family N-acetyltransferase n=1 Tax=Alkalihalobacillus pseudalcaliphilus TaxID=79884 RepID=UPI00064DEC23|nr:GNAT family protein [Alkalihalobacillus pseudalcaliphilus]KMK74495.1 hypothetical protein AB990_20415 [Alkalihalobacillus pseudalcaliphilus]
MTVRIPFFYHLPEIDTPRMTLRQFERRDARKIVELTNGRSNHFHKDKWRQLTYLSEQYIAHMLRCYKIGQPAPWAMVDKQTSYVIGVCGYVDWDRDLARAEIGFELDPSFWRKGWMTEALQAIIPYGFQHCQLQELYAKCLEVNIPSKKLLKKVGMVRIERQKSYLWKEQRYEWVEYYRMSRKEYEERRAGL